MIKRRFLKYLVLAAMLVALALPQQTMAWSSSVTTYGWRYLKSNDQLQLVKTVGEWSFNIEGIHEIEKNYEKIQGEHTSEVRPSNGIGSFVHHVCYYDGKIKLGDPITIKLKGSVSGYDCADDSVYIKYAFVAGGKLIIEPAWTETVVKHRDEGTVTLSTTINMKQDGSAWPPSNIDLWIYMGRDNSQQYADDKSKPKNAGMLQVCFELKVEFDGDSSSNPRVSDNGDEEKEK